MKKVIRKVLALGLAAVLAFGSAQVPVAASAASPTTAPEPETETTITREPGTESQTSASQGTESQTSSSQGSDKHYVTESKVTGKKTASGFTFTGNTRKDGTMTVTSIKKTTKKTVKLSSKITVDGLKYTVTKIGANAFKNATKATKIVIPSTITRVNAKAFSGLSKTVKTIQFNTTKAPEIAKTAFKGVSTKNITITVTKKMSSKEYKNFKKALKAAGFKGTIKRAS